MSNEILENVQTNDSIVLARFESAKRFKMKPATYSATMNARQKLESLQESKNQIQVECTVDQAKQENEMLLILDKKITKLNEKNVELKEFQGELCATNGCKPIRIKKAMINNIESTYKSFEKKSEDAKMGNSSIEKIEKEELKELLNNPAIIKVDVISNTGYSLEEIQNQQIQELLSNRNINNEISEQNTYNSIPGYSLEEIQNQQIQELLNKASEPVNLGYTLEQIQNQEIEKLLNKEGIKRTSKPVIPGYTLEEIQNQEIQKMLEKDNQVRTEIQIVPERFIGLKETIDNEFASQENIQQISREEVEKIVKSGTKQSFVEESHTPDLDRDDLALRIQQSIEEALYKLEQKNKRKAEIQQSITEELRKLDEKNKQKVQTEESRFNFKMPVITFADIFKAANEQEKENNSNINEQISDYEISKSIREQIRNKLNEQKTHKPVVAFSNEDESQNKDSKTIDFQSYKNKISERIRKNDELKAIREQLQRNNQEKANKVQLAQARRKEAEQKFEEYLQKLDEQANNYNNEITEYQNQDNKYNAQINLLEEETNMLYRMLGFED